ncbi:MAG: DUF5615 family PIN-like protein [Gammaproteobacteria bacterium]
MAAFFCDECFSGRTVNALRNSGFDVICAVDVCPAGDDETVLAVAFAHNRVLLTEDYDFGELCVRLGLPSRGVIIVAIKRMPVDKQGDYVVRCLESLGNSVFGAFVNIEPSRVRRRTLMRRQHGDDK